MLSYAFSNAGITDVIAKYPKLRQTSPGVLEGTLDMYAEYDGNTLTGSFQIQITAANPHSVHIPALREIGGRTQDIASTLGVTDLRNLHRNADGTACVCVKQMEKRKFPPGSPLIVFVDELVVPYLYGLSYYEKTKRWPWGDYSHGALGLLEFYATDTQEQTADEIAEVIGTIRRELNWKEYHKQLRKPSSKKNCLCGSTKSLVECHAKAWNGVLRLRSEIDRLGLNLPRLFQRRF